MCVVSWGIVRNIQPANQNVVAGSCCPKSVRWESHAHPDRHMHREMRPHLGKAQSGIFVPAFPMNRVEEINVEEIRRVGGGGEGGEVKI